MSRFEDQHARNGTVLAHPCYTVVVKEGGDRHYVKAWSFGGDVMLESYRYAPGAAAEIPKHAHEWYQFCLSLNFPGEYRYQAETVPVPAGSLAVIHPGEVHSARDPMERRTRAEYRMMYANPDLLREAAAQIEGSGISNPPFFPNPVTLDGDLARRFLEMHAALEGAASRLEKDSRLLSVLTRFIPRARRVERGPGRAFPQPLIRASASPAGPQDPLRRRRRRPRGRP